MPAPTLADVRRALGLSDMTRARLEAISFFVLALLACAGLIRGIWNASRKDFPALPRLSYGRACGVVVLWGLLFVLVLTMVSGARELMTPGAWDKAGLTYRLAPPEPPPVERQIAERYRALDRLRETLGAYADAHGGQFPSPEAAGEIPEDAWRVPAASGGRYIYLGGRATDEYPDRHLPVVYEPDVVGPDRLVLQADGEIVWMPADAVEQASRGRQP
jgi:hypothetical protein